MKNSQDKKVVGLTDESQLDVDDNVVDISDIDSYLGSDGEQVDSILDDDDSADFSAVDSCLGSDSDEVEQDTVDVDDVFASLSDIEDEPEALTDKKAGFFSSVEPSPEGVDAVRDNEFAEEKSSEDLGQDFLSSPGVNDGFGGFELDDPSDSLDEDEPEELTGKKAALFGSVDSSPKVDEHEPMDWLPAEEADLEGQELAEALNDPSFILSDNDGLDDKADSAISDKKSAFFDSVMPPADRMPAFSQRRSVRGKEKARSDLIDEPPVPSVPVKKPPVHADKSINKVATETDAASSVFGSAGGRISASKVDSEITPFLKGLNKESLVGLDLWDDGATASCVRYARGKVQITHAGHVEFSDDGGDAERITELKALWKSVRFPSRSVWVNVHNNSLLQKHVRYDMPVDDLSAYLHREAEESMSGASGNVVLDSMISALPGGGGEGMLYALPVWEQEHLLGLLRESGLYACGMSIPACDLARLHKLTRQNDSGAHCICSMSRAGADIVISYGQASIYSRTIYSRAGGWEENMVYFYESLNDAINYFNSWINKSPVSSVLLCGQLPGVSDFVGELLNETGLLGEVWNPILDGGLLQLVGSARKSGAAGRSLGASLGLALIRE